MTEQSEKALKLFNNGLNCAQAVLYAYCEKYGMSMEMALRLAGGLGSGVRSGDVCGAVSGAVLVAGLKHGQRAPEDLQAKQACYQKTEEFLGAFRGANGSIRCRDLLGCDLSTPEGRKQAKDQNLFGTICTEKVKSALQLLEELGY
jgi:C_GCAxxG_C_C family probable redox protein